MDDRTRTRAATEVMEAVVAAVNTKDAALLASCFAEDAVSVNAGVVMRGRDAIVKDQVKEWEQFPDASVAILRAVVDGDTVAYEVTFRGTNTGPIRTPGHEVIPATGRSVEFDMSIWLELKDGLITRDRRYYDQLAVLGGLGLLGR